MKPYTMVVSNDYITEVRLVRVMAPNPDVAAAQALEGVTFRDCENINQARDHRNQFYVSHMTSIHLLAIVDFVIEGHPRWC